MSQLVDLITQQLNPQTIQSLSRQIDADPLTTQQAVAAALPMLVGSLARNANKSPQEAQSLARALERDHDGSVLDNLAGLLGGAQGGSGLGSLAQLAGGLLGGGSAPKALDGNGILGHLLGAKREPVERGLGQASGLDAAKAGQLLALLAPIVMGALGKMKQRQNLDADGLTAVLNRERADLEKQTPGMSQGGLLGMLDMDDDGQVADDIAKLGGMLKGSGLLGGLFGDR